MGLGYWPWFPPCITLVPMIVPGGAIFWYVLTHVLPGGGITPPVPATPLPAPVTPGSGR